MRLAYFSPLTPLKSGISDFSEELIPALSKYMELDIFVDGYKPANKNIEENYRIYDMKQFENEGIRKKYDEIVYHVGNAENYHESIYKYLLKYPGIVELHDISLHHMLAATTFGRKDYESYIKEMEYCHGSLGKQAAQQFINGEIPPPWEVDSLRFTVNKRVIDSAKAIIVHSDFAKQMVKGISCKPVKTILHHTADIEEDFEKVKHLARQKLKIPSEELVIASFGFASSPKRIKQILSALSKVKKHGFNFKYYIVGQVAKELELECLVNGLDLCQNVIITGYVDLEKFKEYMRACDICFNLRYPTQGESSGSLHRMLGMGKITFVSKIGSFIEYPDDVVIKIDTGENEIDEIFLKLMDILININKIDFFKTNAIQFAKEKCSLEINTLKYKEFFESIHNNGYCESDTLEILADRLDELEIYEEDFICNIVNRLFSII